MSQSRKMSAVESITNVVVGYLVALAAQIIFFPMVGVHADINQNLAIGVIFTIVSLARSYALRRVFNWIGR